MEIKIPGRKTLDIKHLLLDYNGTIAVDGQLIKIVEEKINILRERGINAYILTADTHGNVKNQCGHMPVEIKVFDSGEARFAKERIANELGKENCASIGNGYNDGLMFKACDLSIIILGKEGCAVEALQSADIVCSSIEDALDLLINEKRLIATLRG